MATERELKYALPDRESYQRLYAKLKAHVHTTKYQLNLYLATQGHLLLSQGLSLRYRLEKQGNRVRHFLTLKGAHQVEGDVHTALEFQEEGTQALLSTLLAGEVPVTDLMDWLNPKGLAIPRLHTRVFVDNCLLNRRDAFRTPGFDLLLDAIKYIDCQREYEMECETNDVAGARQQIKQLLRYLGIPALGGLMTKRSRAYQHLANVAPGPDFFRRAVHSFVSGDGDA